MLQLAQQSTQRSTHQFHVGLTHSETEIIEAQRLRYRVFAEELGARLHSRIPGVDQDHYDPFCEHLIVRDDEKARIVGTYRILSPENARRVGNYYSENEFDLNRLNHLRGSLVEVGRSCIDPEYRTGGVIAMLWTGLVRYMRQNNFEYLIGCASISMGDGGHNAANLFVQLVDKHIAPIEYRVTPRCALPFEKLVTGRPAELPPLLRGYLRAGAWVCGEPAWDPDFNTADLLLLLPMANINARYARHFIERQAA
ncbi:MAG: GNAT family N-acyltransferase [Sterolibacterium sp.]